jgi:hypothetical protein
MWYNTSPATEKNKKQKQKIFTQILPNLLQFFFPFVIMFPTKGTQDIVAFSL